MRKIHGKMGTESKVSGKNDDAIAKQQNRLQLVRKKMMNAAEQRENVNRMLKSPANSKWLV